MAHSAAAAAGRQRSRSASGAASSARHRSGGRARDAAESYILGTPARFMRPRIVLLVACGLLVAFGLLMIYSASSIMAMTDAASGNNPFYYLTRQGIYALIGAVLCAVLAKADYHLWCERFLKPIWLFTLFLLVIIFGTSLGQDAYGASRWISIGGFSLQPSEFAKITMLLTGAYVAQGWQTGTLDTRGTVFGILVGVGVPLAAILLQPDKGTVMVIACTLVVMAYLSGVGWKPCVVVLLAGLAAMIGLSLLSSYSRARIVTMLDPWKDEWGAGYQLIQGFYAFGSGGLTGVGLGFSRQKYSYLPMAHNDFIFAVIGEELGLVGTLGLIAGFAVLLWAAFQIARYAPDLEGRLIAAGSVTMLCIQLFLNVAGVIGIFPLSGKPIPFISYGGSSVISSLMLIGLCASVSVHSKLPETPYDRRRHDLSVTRAPEGGQRMGGLRLHEGGLSSAFEAGQASRRPAPGGTSGAGARGRLTTDPASGHRRLDLGPSAADRLRERQEGPRTRR